jgi:hypothetical protein
MRAADVACAPGRGERPRRDGRPRPRGVRPLADAGARPRRPVGGRRCGSADVAPYVLPAPLRRAARRWIADWPVLWPVAPGSTLDDHLRRAWRSAIRRRRGPGACCSTVRALARIFGLLSDTPMILQVTPIVAIAPLLLVWLEQRRRRCSSAPGSSPSFPVLANTALGLNSADRNLRCWSCSGSTAPVRWQTLCDGCGCRRRCPPFLGGLKHRRRARR